MSAQVEAIALELDRLRNAPHGSVGFEHRSGAPSATEHVRRGQAGGSSAEDRCADALFPAGFASRARDRLLDPELLDLCLQRLAEEVVSAGDRDRSAALDERPVDSLDRSDDVEPELR